MLCSSLPATVRMSAVQMTATPVIRQNQYISLGKKKEARPHLKWDTCCAPVKVFRMAE